MTEIPLEALDTPDHTQVGHWISLNPYVSPHARKLYDILAAFVNRGRRTEGDTNVWPSMNLLAVLLGLSSGDKVTPYMDELIHLRAVEKRPQRTPDGLKTRNVYGVRFKAPPGSGLAMDFEDVLAPYQRIARDRDAMSDHARKAKDAAQRAREAVKQARKDGTPPYPQKQRYGTTCENEETPGQPVPPDSGVRTPESGGQVPPDSGAEQEELEQEEELQEEKGRRSATGPHVDGASAPGGEPPEPDLVPIEDGPFDGWWDADRVREALPPRAKVSGVGADRMAARCNRLEDAGVDRGAVERLLQSVPQSAPEARFADKTPTARAARAAADKVADVPGVRPDVDQVCDHLARSMVEYGFSEPKVGVAWRREVRLMLDNDKVMGKPITAESAVRIIDAAFGKMGPRVEQPRFYAKHLQSAAKLRKHIETIAVLWREDIESRASAGGGKSRTERVNDASKYGTTPEMLVHWYRSQYDPNGYGYEASQADREGRLEEFLESHYGPRNTWGRKGTVFDRFFEAQYAGDTAEAARLAAEITGTPNGFTLESDHDGIDVETLPI